MQDVGGDGCGVIATTFGPTASPFIHQACMAMCNQCNALGMPFVLMFDPWVVKNPATSQIYPSPIKEQMYIAALQHSDTQFMLNSPSYLTTLAGIPGKPIIDFDTTVDKLIVLKAVPGISLFQDGFDFDWPRIPSRPNSTKLPVAFMEFNDGTGPDRNKSRWNQTIPARIVPSLAGRTFWSMNCSAAVDYIQFATWNDYAETTNMEQFAAMVWGRI
jgi:hypothetical protein